MANLTLVPSPADVEQAEADVLERAIEDMASWIESLPTSSTWRWSFIRARKRLEPRLAQLREAGW